jgi:membrane-anchored protein YejM (alkaline phosphatase superfamily)
MQTLYQERLRSMLSGEGLLDQIIATLRETGELDNTYILFTSDNGFHMGNHRLRVTAPVDNKRPCEEDIRVALMARGPGVRRSRASRAGHKQRPCAYHRRPRRRPYSRVRRREFLCFAAD